MAPVLRRMKKISWLAATGPRTAPSSIPESMGGGPIRVMVSTNLLAATGTKCIGKDRNCGVRTSVHSHSIETELRECSVMLPSFGPETCNPLGRHCALTCRLRSTPACREFLIGARTLEDSYRLLN